VDFNLAIFLDSSATGVLFRLVTSNRKAQAHLAKREFFLICSLKVRARRRILVLLMAEQCGVLQFESFFAPSTCIILVSRSFNFIFVGVPTTRAASLVVSDKTKVVRDKLYTGNAQ
jgi:hypothetical protein